LNLQYVLPRVVRHFLPERFTRFLLLHSIVIRAGLETSEPVTAARRYIDNLAARRETLAGKRVMVFGYGGRFDVGIALLEAGAGHVVLCEKYAPPDDKHNVTLRSGHGRFLVFDDGKPRPRSEFMTLLQADIRDLHPSSDLPLCDYVFSSSVYEHLDDVDGITCALAEFTKPEGLQIHYVDLRDHFFKYPFEMLMFSEKVWFGWLNPTSNHNRFRLQNYRHVFEKYFAGVEIEVLERDEAAFQKARPRIRAEFLTGNLQDDSVTLILVMADHPRRKTV
jgi:hypothetical protein